MSDPRWWEFVAYALFRVALVATLAWYVYRVRCRVEDEEGDET